MLSYNMIQFKPTQYSIINQVMEAQAASGSAAAINIISGFTQTASAGASALKSGYINYALWPTLPTTAAGAITAVVENPESQEDEKGFAMKRKFVNEDS
jgi:hypothetical protein